jgi:hypothetical protein
MTPIYPGDLVRVTNQRSAYFGQVVRVVQLGDTGGVWVNTIAPHGQAYVPFGYEIFRPEPSISLDSSSGIGDDTLMTKTTTFRVVKETKGVREVVETGLTAEKATRFVAECNELAAEMYRPKNRPAYWSEQE